MQKFPKVFTLMSAILALAFCLASCKSNVDDDPTVTPQKTAGSISYATASVSKTTDDAAFTNELTKTGDGTVTYASSKETVATVNATTGEVTIAGAGETTITATVADSDTYTYATKTASYTLTVTQDTPSYTVTFDSDGGSEVEKQTVESGKIATKPADPTKASTASAEYTFSGWYKGDTAFDFATAITEDITLKAKWTEKAITPTPTATYTVTIASGITNGMVKSDKTSAAKGDTVTLTIAASDGYELDTISVKDASNNEGTINEVTKGSAYSFTMPESNVTVSATFKETAETANRNAANAVIAKINAIGTVEYTDESKAKIDEARTAYDALTEAQKALVSEETLNLLTAAETKYSGLKAVGFVKVSGTTITGSETWTPSSSVFVSGRSLTIPDMYVCDHEVTQKEYETYCKYGGSSSPSDANGKGDDFPAYYVSWYDAIVYCNRRSMDEGLTPVYAIGSETDPSKWTDIVSETTDGVTKYCGPDSSNNAWNALTYDTTADGYRLPTEAEWEYIARGAASSSTTYSGSDTIDDVAWYMSNSGSKANEVKTKAANSLGIYDMTGNVFEWCYDWSESSISSSTGASGASSGTDRVRRGGSWTNGASNCKVANRGGYSPYFRGVQYGFRLVRNAN